MHNQIYERIKKIIYNNYKIFITWIIIIFLLTFNLPFYINKPGGIIDVSNRFEISGHSSGENNLHMAYVTELKATIPIWILANFMPSWDIIKKEKIVLKNETIKDVNFRNHLMLEDANNNAVMVAYKYANKKVTIVDEKFFISYVSESADTDLSVGDEILLINNSSINSLNDITNEINRLNAGDKLTIKVTNNNKELDRYAYIKNEEGRNIIGILITPKREIITDPPIKFNFSKNESGPSGGLMMSLAIYSSLIDKDITKGIKIAGTGTINQEGLVGEISGIKHKLRGAVKAGMEIFLVPAGKNTTEALELKEKENLNIKIVSIESFEEALSFLETL